jgi:hypothetical protein
MNNRKMRIKMKAIKKKSMQCNLTIKMIKMEMKMKMKMRIRMRMRMMKNSFDDSHILKINIYASELKVKF